MQTKLGQIVFIVSVVFLNGCTFYKSEGRKNFESQAPSQVKTLSFMGCQDQMPELSNYETLQTPEGQFVYIVHEQEQVFVYTLFNEKNHEMACAYRASNQSHWLAQKDLFLSELDSLTIN